MVKDESSTEKLHWQFTVKDLQGIDREEQAPYTAAIGYLMYKLDKNTANNTIITSYKEVAQNLYAFYYP